MKRRRPTTRQDCIGPGSVRPCPWVGCRHHLGGDVYDHRSGPRWAPNPRADAAGLLPYSCSLDIVEDHPEGLDRKQVAWLLGVSSDRVMHIERHALRKLYATDLARKGELSSLLQAALEEHSSPPPLQRRTTVVVDWEELE